MQRFWSQAIQFPLLVAVTLTFTFGTCIVDYLGYPLDVWNILLGLVSVWFILIGSRVLYGYFDLVSRGAQPFSIRRDFDGLESPSPQVMLIVVIVLLTFVVAFGYTLARNVSNADLVILMLAGLMLASVLFWGQPRMVYSGYGELIQALVICSLVPAFAFSIQSTGIHQILLPVTFPLILIFLGITLAMELESYAGDLKQSRRSLLIRISWQRGIWLQHLFILMGFVLLAAAPLFGVAWRLVWPSTLVMPVAILEIWLVNRIALGLPPRWPLLRVTGWLTFILPTYLLAITFWRA
jgi:1,4-dihydroxy-2-naphthoate octaprenyltransferase